MVRAILRVLKFASLTLLAGALVLMVYVYRTWDRVWDAPLPDVHASTNPEIIERGEYLVFGPAHCSGCHSPLNQVTFALAGPEFSGGVPIEPRLLPGVDPALRFQPPNLTPLRGSALKRFPDRATFVARFQKGGRKYDASPMPWDCFSRMSADDAGALYEFFQSLPPAGQPSPEQPVVRQGS